MLVFLIFALLFESSVFSLPFVFITLLFFAVTSQSRRVFLFALISGIILDAMMVRTIGSSSLFFCTFLFLVFLYQRKFEITSVYFVLVATGAGTFIYGSLFGMPHIWSYVIASCLFAMLLCAVLLRRFKKSSENMAY